MTRGNLPTLLVPPYKPPTLEISYGQSHAQG